MKTYQEIKNQIADLKKELKALQNKCKHPANSIEYYYGTRDDNSPGNEAGYSCCYFFRCTQCDKRWTRDYDSKLTVPKGSKEVEKFTD